MIKEAMSGRKRITLASQLSENLSELLSANELRPQIVILPVATTRFPHGIISKTAENLINKFGPPSKAAIQILEQGESVLEELSLTYSGERNALAEKTAQWEDEIHSIQDATRDRVARTLVEHSSEDFLFAT